MHVWLPFQDEDAALDAVGAMPKGVRFTCVDDPMNLPDERDDVVFWVLPNGVRPETFAQMADMPGLRAIQLGSAGYEHVLEHLPAGINVCNAGGVHDTAVAEIAVGMAIAQSRHLDRFARAQAEGRWAPEAGPGIADKRVLIVGYGRIGAAIEARLLPFEVSQIVRQANRPRTEPVLVHGAAELPALLPEADLLFVITPHTPQTEGMLGTAELALLPDNALVVNVGRGKVIDTDALLAEVASGRLRCALDVVDPEPLPADHPLWRQPGALIVPHVGGASDAFEPRMNALIARQLAHLAAGEPFENIVV